MGKESQMKMASKRSALLLMSHLRSVSLVAKMYCLFANASPTKIVKAAQDVIEMVEKKHPTMKLQLHLTKVAETLLRDLRQKIEMHRLELTRRMTMKIHVHMKKTKEDLAQISKKIGTHCSKLMCWNHWVAKMICSA